MNRTIKIAYKITKSICAEENTYIYDPDHKKHPGGGYHKTEKGWSKIDTEDRRDQERRMDIPHSRRQYTEQVLKGLFTEEEKNIPKKTNDKYNDESSFYVKAIESQKLMENKLDNGNEEKIFGKGASRCEMSEEDIMKPGPKLVIGKIKSPERAREKVKSDFNGNWGKLTDGVRCSIAVDRVEDIPGVLNGLRKSGCKISAPPKNRFEKRLKSGYGDCLLNMDFGNGFIGEVQIHLKNMLVAKEFRGGHKLYEAERKVYAKYDSDTPVEKYKYEDQDILKDLISEQKKIYNRAYEDSIVVASKGEKMKYILSNNEYSYYRYGSLDFPAFCYKNNFPQFYNGENWVQVKSFLDFADNAVEIDEDTFMEDLKKAGISFDEK